MAVQYPLIVAFIATSLALGTYGQDGFCPASCAASSCCNNYLMDNNRREAIDFNSTVLPGSYGGVAVKLCATDPFSLDLWAPVIVGRELFEFKFEVQYPGVSNGWKEIQRNNEKWWAINFTDPLNLNRVHYVGVMALAERIPIPYTKNAPRTTQDGQQMYHSITIGNIQGGTPQRSIGFTRASIERLPWERSFQPFIEWCGPQGCLDEAACVGCRGPPGKSGPAGPPGPPGAPCLGFSADQPDNPINVKLNTVEGKSDVIINEITKLGDSLTRLGGGNRPTGLCAKTFFSGEYGVGNCYQINNVRKTFGEAAINCIEGDSHLVDIEDLAEDGFLARTVQATIQTNENNRTFFTSGIYSRNLKTWVWYDERRLQTTVLSYQNWASNEEAGYRAGKNCLLLQVFADKTFRWISGDCNDKHLHICKQTKRCY